VTAASRAGVAYRGSGVGASGRGDDNSASTLQNRFTNVGFYRLEGPTSRNAPVTGETSDVLIPLPPPHLELGLELGRQEDGPPYAGRYCKARKNGRPGTAASVILVPSPLAGAEQKRHSRT